MNVTKRIDPTYYETHCFGDDFYEAERNGELIIPEPDETTIDAIMRYARSRREYAVAVEA